MKKIVAFSCLILIVNYFFIFYFTFLQSIGPCLIDTTPPDFTGTISTTLSGNFLIASWPENAFTDSEEFYSLTYEYSIGKFTLLCTHAKQFIVYKIISFKI